MRFGYVLLASAVVVGGLAFLLWSSDSNPSRGDKPLVFFCAKGINKPAQKVIDEYQQTYGVTIQTRYDGSGTLKGALDDDDRVDLYLAADISYLDEARKEGKIHEIIRWRGSDR